MQYKCKRLLLVSILLLGLGSLSPQTEAGIKDWCKTAFQKIDQVTQERLPGWNQLKSGISLAGWTVGLTPTARLLRDPNKSFYVFVESPLVGALTNFFAIMSARSLKAVSDLAIGAEATPILGDDFTRNYMDSYLGYQASAIPRTGVALTDGLSENQKWLLNWFYSAAWYSLVTAGDKLAHANSQEELAYASGLVAFSVLYPILTQKVQIKWIIPYLNKHFPERSDLMRIFDKDIPFEELLQDFDQLTQDFKTGLENKDLLIAEIERVKKLLIELSIQIKWHDRDSAEYFDLDIEIAAQKINLKNLKRELKKRNHYSARLKQITNKKKWARRIRSWMERSAIQEDINRDLESYIDRDFDQEILAATDQLKLNKKALKSLKNKKAPSDQVQALEHQLDIEVARDLVHRSQVLLNQLKWMKKSSGKLRRIGTQTLEKLGSALKSAGGMIQTAPLLGRPIRAFTDWVQSKELGRAHLQYWAAKTKSASMIAITMVSTYFLLRWSTVGFDHDHPGILTHVMDAVINTLQSFG